MQYEIKRTKMGNLIDDELEASSSDNETESDDEKDNDKLDEQFLKAKKVF